MHHGAHPFFREQLIEQNPTAQAIEQMHARNPLAADNGSPAKQLRVGAVSKLLLHLALTHSKNRLATASRHFSHLQADVFGSAQLQSHIHRRFVETPLCPGRHDCNLAALHNLLDAGNRTRTLRQRVLCHSGVHFALTSAQGKLGSLCSLSHQHQAHAHLMQSVSIEQGIHQLTRLQQAGSHMHHKQAAAEIRHILQRRTNIHNSSLTYTAYVPYGVLNQAFSSSLPAKSSGT